MPQRFETEKIDDLLHAEGFSRAPLPKVEVFRRAVASSPIYADAGQTTDRWTAIVTDDDGLRASCPVLRFNDTMWLQLLANLAWDGALILTA